MQFARFADVIVVLCGSLYEGAVLFSSPGNTDSHAERSTSTFFGMLELLTSRSVRDCMAGSFLLKLKRQETPFYRFLHKLARKLQSSDLPLPHFFHPVLRVLYSSHIRFLALIRGIYAYFYVEPLFRGRCESIGKRFTVYRLPYVPGHTKIFIGDDVNFFGQVDINSGRVFDEPKLTIGNRVVLGHLVSFVVNKEIILDDDVKVASDVSFSDSDSHPLDADERAANLPPHPDDIKPVRICKKVWIGRRALIMKGVTIGEGAIIGAGSVVTRSIPAGVIAVGNPARVLVKDSGQRDPAEVQPAYFRD